MVQPFKSSMKHGNGYHKCFVASTRYPPPTSQALFLNKLRAVPEICSIFRLSRFLALRVIFTHSYEI
jgi:hypothetical protein